MKTKQEQIIELIDAALDHLKSIALEGMTIARLERWRANTANALDHALGHGPAEGFLRHVRSPGPNARMRILPNPRRTVDSAVAFLTDLRQDVPELLHVSALATTASAVLHARIDAASRSLIEKQEYPAAVQAAGSALEDVVRQHSRRGDLSGAQLMRTAFAKSAPLLLLADNADPKWENEQDGFMQLFAGAMMAVRNRANHAKGAKAPERAIEYVQLFSLLAKLADEAIAQVTP